MSFLTLLYLLNTMDIATAMPVAVAYACLIAAFGPIYAELKLEDVYHAYEDRAYAETCAAIDAVCDDGSMPRAVFNMVLSKIYKRKA